MFYQDSGTLYRELTIENGELPPYFFDSSTIYNNSIFILNVRFQSGTPCTNNITPVYSIEPTNKRVMLYAFYPDGGLVSGHLLSMAYTLFISHNYL